jgi:hypothetical protein
MRPELARHTESPCAITCTVDFEGHEPEEVFEIMGDPSRIPDWFLLARAVRESPQQSGFIVDFVLFGEVEEQILHLAPPDCYVYSARGSGFPILDYVAMIEVQGDGNGCGTMRWSLHYSQFVDATSERVIDGIMPAVMKSSMERLAPLIGGVRNEVVDLRSRDPLA